VDEALLDEYIARYSNWGRWGDSDEVGAANFISDADVLAAARTVRRGQVLSLSLPFGVDGPQTGANGRFNCIRFSVASGTDYEMGRQQWGGQPLPNHFGFADDTVVLHLQSATHWDGLCHIFHKQKMYNGYPASDHTTGAGASHNGLEQMAGRLVGRGVLLDVPRAKGVDWLEDGYAITIADLEEAAEHGGVEVREGDILLLRTGKLARCRKEGWGTFAGGDAPGMSFFTIPWLHERRVAALASDTWGVEVRPNEFPDSFQPFHIPTIVYMGLLLGEMFDFEQLSEACGEDGVHEMLLCASPLPFVGAAGGPPGPVAIR
jgi:kynurenine formamidase